MSAQPLQGTPDHVDPPPEWLFRLGLHEPDQRAKKLAEALVDDPFEVIGYTAVAATYFGNYFGELVDWLAEHEPVLRTALPVVAAAMPWLLANEHLQLLGESDQAALPKWLRELDQLTCTGIMRRYDRADRSSSSYLIEVRLAGGQVATARLSIAHDDVDRICEFWTTGLSVREAARIYRKRYTLHTTRPYRHVKLETACCRILKAWLGSLESGRFVEDRDDPIPWPQNAGVLLLMMQPAVTAAEGQHG
jgi:hypothetical protein